MKITEYVARQALEIDTNNNYCLFCQNCKKLENTRCTAEYCVLSETKVLQALHDIFYFTKTDFN